MPGAPAGVRLLQRNRCSIAHTTVGYDPHTELRTKANSRGREANVRRDRCCWKREFKPLRPIWLIFCLEAHLGVTLPPTCYPHIGRGSVANFLGFARMRRSRCQVDLCGAAVARAGNRPPLPGTEHHHIRRHEHLRAADGLPGLCGEHVLRVERTHEETERLEGDGRHREAQLRRGQWLLTSGLAA